MDLIYKKEKREIREATKKMASLLDKSGLTYKEFMLALPTILAVAFKNQKYNEKQINEYIETLQKIVVNTLKKGGYL
ncbi:MAG: hypothetical protein ACP5LI_05970 [Hydrogenobaculum sp.]